MIEINLVPDVKQELLKAQRVRTGVISTAILIGLAALAIVALLLIWVFGVQTARGLISDNTIKNESHKLQSVPDIGDTLTIQNQLATISTLSNSEHIDSRLFDVLTTVNPPAPNNIQINTVTLDTDNTAITLEAQASGGYSALEVFKKTINATKFQYTQDGQTQEVALASNMSDSDRSYGEDASGAKVLRFTLTFTYPQELFARTSTDARIVAPGRTNATDSFLGVPQALFTERAKDTGEGGE